VVQRYDIYGIITGGLRIVIFDLRLLCDYNEGWIAYIVLCCTVAPAGAILTKMDGDSRGGAALSVREVSLQVKADN